MTPFSIEPAAAADSTAIAELTRELGYRVTVPVVERRLDGILGGP